MLPGVSRRSRIYRPSDSRDLVKQPNYSSWARTFMKGGYDQRGRPIAKKTDKPMRLTFIWGGYHRDEIIHRIIDDAATYFGCRPKRIAMVDHGKKRICWDLEGKTTDVLTYDHTGGAY